MKFLHLTVASILLALNVYTFANQPGFDDSDCNQYTQAANGSWICTEYGQAEEELLGEPVDSNSMPEKSSQESSSDESSGGDDDAEKAEETWWQKLWPF